jgi:hypothetical protein
MGVRVCICMGVIERLDYMSDGVRVHECVHELVHVS